MKIENLKEKLLNFENENDAKVLYVTKYGSKLYGTDNPNSDTDYKGVFVQATDLILLKKDLDHWTSNSNNTNEKNGVDDIDLQLFSLHKFFQLLRKGETGALDLLFSMWSNSVVYKDQVFVDHMQMYYTKFLNRKLHSFTGYAVSQAKKYGVKGSRYKELKNFVEYFTNVVELHSETKKLEVLFGDFETYFKNNDTKYLSMTQAEGPKTGKGENMVDYVKLLGKKFSGDVTVDYFFERVNDMLDQFGNRAKSAMSGTDMKSLSHAVRVLLEVEELLDTGFMKFPLTEKEFVTSVKEGRKDVDEVMEFVNSKLDVVKEKLETSNLPESSDRETMDWIELFFLELYN